jgi:hypothetical protein
VIQRVAAPALQVEIPMVVVTPALRVEIPIVAKAAHSPNPSVGVEGL